MVTKSTETQGIRQTGWGQGIGTLNMLHFLKVYKRYLHISYHTLDFVQQKKTKFIMEQPYMLPILYCQYYACWCPGDFRSQGISSHGIDQISQNIPSPAKEELTYLSLHIQVSLSILNHGNLSQLPTASARINSVEEIIKTVPWYLSQLNYGPLTRYTQQTIAGRACAGNAGNAFPATAG